MSRVLKIVAAVVVVAAVLVGAGWLLFGRGEDGPVVNVYSGRSHYGTEEVFRRFEEQTGIRVEIFGGGSPELVERISAEGERTRADLLITTDVGYLWRSTEEGQLAPVTSTALTSAVPENLRDPEGRWYAISRRARTIMRSTERVPEAEAPTTYAGLGDPRWKGRLCLRTSNNVYNQSLTAMLIAERGEAATRALLESWMANEPTVLGSDVEVLEAVAQGRCDVALTNTYYLGNELRDDAAFPVAPVWAEQDGAGTHVNVSGVGLVRWAQHREEAVRLMEYLLTPEAQELIAEGNSEYPVREGVPAASWIQGWGEFRADPAPLVDAGRFQPQAVQLMNEVGWR